MVLVILIQGSENSGLKIPFPPLKEELEAKSHKSQQKKKEKAKLPTEPKYSVLHRGEFSIQDFTCTRESTLVKRPKELVVNIELPGVELASSVELDIFEKKIVLNSKTPPYKLDVSHNSYVQSLPKVGDIALMLPLSCCPSIDEGDNPAVWRFYLFCC